MDEIGVHLSQISVWFINSVISDNNKKGTLLSQVEKKSLKPKRDTFVRNQFVSEFKWSEEKI